MDPPFEIQTLVKKTLAKLLSQKHLPESAKALLLHCPQISNFYLLPKIHKANNPGPPIVSSRSCPTVLISQYIVGPQNDLERFINIAEMFCPFLKFTHNISNSSVVFLDTELSISDRKIKSNLHFKPTDSHNYLMYPFNHPRSCTNLIPYSQLLRARRICSDDQCFVKVSKQIISFCEQRQYPQRVLSNALKRIQRIDRDSALAPKTDQTPTRCIPFVLPFHPSVTPIVRAIDRNVETLRHDPSIRDHFPEPPPPPSQHSELKRTYLSTWSVPLNLKQ
ncbi:hypothetical protein HOLleu_18899 [Holothuria leucospilota]|uniref:Helix-turn-helix domain-containing protein n=1 Tax=Holothuria leucospilota TaxID=206669 RepID=A0A9Q1HA06_HOLLE|nr:hypothetical protein HOLleu_18899 [Holothuria leucospilota]